MNQSDLTERRAGDARRGDVVRVRSADEILATLGPDGTLGNLPFMPEMLAHCGKEMAVAARADKTCDTLEWTGNRRMAGTVHLVGARCDGSAHGGCQASCNLFWREEWLEWPDRDGAPIAQPVQRDTAVPVATLDTLTAATRAPGDDSAFRCQATELIHATSPMPRHHYVQYLNDVRTRNVSAWVALRGLAVFAFNKYQRLSKRTLPAWLRIRGGRDYPFVIGTGTGERTPATPLQPGDLVEIKSKAEIVATLDANQRSGNLWFDAEMLPYCGRRARVKTLVTRLLDEKTGKMIKVRDCVVLEDVVCLGVYHLFCQRAITPYWRSEWLRKV